MTSSDSQDGFVASHHEPENATDEKPYQKLEEPFEHIPLPNDQIRVLKLLPGRHDIFCTIEEADIDFVSADYEALSYCWGDKNQSKHTIWINVHPFEVLSNLYAALAQLRDYKSSRKLWANAICINQVGKEGTAEKSVQIPLMDRIYHQAARVVVWLGAAENSSDEVFDIIAQQNMKDMLTYKFVMDFGILLKRLWFRRTWIVQELILAKQLPQLMCGSRVVTYGKFMATHWVLPGLVHGAPVMEWYRTIKTIDSQGNVKSS